MPVHIKLGGSLYKKVGENKLECDDMKLGIPCSGVVKAGTYMLVTQPPKPTCPVACTQYYVWSTRLGEL
jgi:hypothetical protein